MKIEQRMLKRSCENEKVRDIDGAQESTRTVRTSSPPCGKLVCCRGSDISALIAPPTISKTKDLLMQMPHTTACVFMAVVRILPSIATLSNSGFQVC